MNMWPQALVAFFIITVTIAGIVRHGQMPDKPIDRLQTIATSLWVALVLGAGGFWNPR